MDFQDKIKIHQVIRKANIVGQFKEPDLFFKAVNSEEFICTNLDIEKAKKIVVGYEHGGYVVTGFYENGQPKWKSKKKHLKEQTGGTEKTDTNKVAEFAKNASEDDLRRAIKEHGDEAVRTAAHNELKRREQEESTATHPDTKEVEEKLNEKSEGKTKPKKKVGDNHSGTYNDQAPGFDKEKGDVDVTGTKGEKIPKSKLSPEAQTVLDKSLVEYNKATPEAQTKMVGIVKKQLEIHENGMKSVGMGLADHMVEAGKEFLKVVEEEVKNKPIGKTSSGKDIYNDAKHKNHKDFDFQDHEEASQIQEKIFRNAPAHSVEGSHALRQSDEHDRALEKENPKEREKRRTENLIKSIDKLGSNILIGSKKSQVGIEKYRIAEGMNGLYQLQLTYDDDSFAKFKVTREELDNYLRTGDVPPNKK